MQQTVVVAAIIDTFNRGCHTLPPFCIIIPQDIEGCVQCKSCYHTKISSLFSTLQSNTVTLIACIISHTSGPGGCVPVVTTQLLKPKSFGHAASQSNEACYFYRQPVWILCKLLPHKIHNCNQLL